jgi:Flp pilus assembly protein TadG
METMVTFQRGIAATMRFAQRRRTEGSECGSAILETALSMIVLLTFLFGLMETCLMLYTYHFISEAAREGTRYAVVRGSTAGGSNCAAPGAATCIAQGGNNIGDIATYVKGLSFPGIDPSNMTVNSSWSAYVHGSTCGTPCNSPGNLVTVKVIYNFPLTIPFVPAHTFALSSTSAMIISQ